MMSRPGVENDGVSVILIVRNGAATIARALESVVAQVPSPLEILVIDGDSSDASRDVAAGFRDVRVLRQQTRGISHAYNEGVREARGGYVAFISCDDVWLPGKLAAQVEHLREHPQALCVLAHCEHRVLDGQSPAAGFRMDLLHRAVPGWIMETLMARRAMFDAVGPFDSQFVIGEDTDWFARARDAGVRMDMLPGVFLHKGVHGANASVIADSASILLNVLRRSVERKRSATA